MEPFEQRLIDELIELRKKRVKLDAFTGTETFNSLSRNHRELLHAQAGAMFAYEQILKLRLDDLGVDYANQVY